MFSELSPMAGTNFPPLLCANTVRRLLHSGSRQVKQGDIFIACQSRYMDGRSYIPTTIADGTTFIFWDDDGKFEWNPEQEVPNQGIKNLKHRVSMLAAQIYDSVSDDLKVWGATGINSKISIAQQLAQAADLLGEKITIIGAVGSGFWSALEKTTYTTPAPVDVRTLLYRFRQQGAAAAAIEVSSYDLDQSRINSVPLRSTVFTSLTRDHLDYHDTMEAYGAVKSRLFYWHGLKHAAINIDDEYDTGLAGRLKEDCPDLAAYSYGFNGHADIHIVHFAASSDGMEAIFQTPWGGDRYHTRLLGRLDTQSLAACIALLCIDGYPFDKVLDVLAKIHPVSSRMGCIMNSDKPLVAVDHAHTPDTLEKALATLQKIKPQDATSWYVFGCGGNRDRDKRPLMDTATVQGAGKVVVTNDGPRLGDPQDIINDTPPAVPTPECVEADRAIAIRYAVKRTASGDVILVAGKGHEDYQDMRGVKYHFSDFEVAERALAGRI